MQTPLTRRRDPDRHRKCWHIYYGDTRVGTIAEERAGVPVDADQWEWRVGFYPLNQRPGRHVGDSAATFDQARAAFEEAWRAYLPRCTEPDFAEHRRHRAFTSWKYKMHDEGMKLPTQLTSGISKCFCGAPLTIASVDSHIEQAHMDMA